MSIARKIADALRALARRIDDRPVVSREEMDARLAAIMAKPRRVNQWAPLHFDNKMTGGRHAPDVALAVRIASDYELRDPGCYTGNDEMVAAIGRYRAGGGL